jgi:sterol desaturase/sphingolipid hydroxylase (fatty acid hydroxylase superfamily)
MTPDPVALTAQKMMPFVLLVFAGSILIEMAIAKLFNKKLYDFDDTLQNLTMFFVNRMMGGLGGAFMFGILTAIGQFVPWKLLGAIGFVVTFLIIDFLYYLQHRIFHTDSVFAPFHEVHHTSGHYNLTTTLRASVFLPLINPLFYVPAALFGCGPLEIIVCFGIIQIYQLFLHTQLIPSMGFLEGILNTPSAHRTHHGNKQWQYQSNLGGMFVLWDRLFGTYHEEPAELIFGITGVKQENNFFIAQVNPFVTYIKRVLDRSAKRFRQL